MERQRFGPTAVDSGPKASTRRRSSKRRGPPLDRVVAVGAARTFVRPTRRWPRPRQKHSSTRSLVRSRLRERAGHQAADGRCPRQASDRGTPRGDARRPQAASDGAAVAGRRWTPRYAARRIAWHALDHAWEIEDRSNRTAGSERSRSAPGDHFIEHGESSWTDRLEAGKGRGFPWWRRRGAAIGRRFERSSSHNYEPLSGRPPSLPARRLTGAEAPFRARSLSAWQGLDSIRGPDAFRRGFDAT